jgi:biopolymer transport protein ExbD
MVPVEVLAERVRQLVQDTSRRDVFLRGDGEVQLKELMDVLGRLKAGGIEKVGILAEERRQGQ